MLTIAIYDFKRLCRLGSRQSASLAPTFTNRLLRVTKKTQLYTDLQHHVGILLQHKWTSTMLHLLQVVNRASATFRTGARIRRMRSVVRTFEVVCRYPQTGSWRSVVPMEQESTTTRIAEHGFPTPWLISNIFNAFGSSSPALGAVGTRTGTTHSSAELIAPLAVARMGKASTRHGLSARWIVDCRGIAVICHTWAR